MICFADGVILLLNYTKMKGDGTIFIVKSGTGDRSVLREKEEKK